MGEDNNAVVSEGLASGESIDSIVQESTRRTTQTTVGNPLLHMIRKNDVAEWRYDEWPYRLTDAAELVLANSPRVIEKTFSPGFAQGYSARIPLPSERVRLAKVADARKAWQDMIDGNPLKPGQRELIKLYNLGIGVLGTPEIWNEELRVYRTKGALGKVDTPYG